MIEDSKMLYKSFTKFAIALAVRSGLSLRKSKQLVSAEFESHPYGKKIEGFIDVMEDEKDNIISLLNDCVRICDELGPSRDYFTLEKVLEVVNNNSKKSEDEASNISPFIDKFKSEIHTINQKIPKPPLFNMVLESRSLLEWASIYCIFPFIPKRIKGKNKPVLLIPPYLGDDYATSFVRKYLQSLGFTTYKWDLGFNMVKSHYIPRLEEKLDDIYEKHQEKVSIVGWSGGGIFAKIMANRHPNQVEQIITIGSPVWGVMEMKTPVYGILEFFRGKSLKERNERFLKELEPIPDVPICCIYTKTDGLLPWKHCMEAETYRKNIKNIEVFGSHSGMGANASVMLITANALSANIKGTEIQDETSNIERILYPNFWTKKTLLNLLPK
jgi:pimeloyl-ACP methyl ester carboxylesterase